MNRDLRRRIEQLEERTSCDPITLVFADGSQRVINGSVRHWRALNAALFERDSEQPDSTLVPASHLLLELDWLQASEQILGTNAQVFALTKALCSSNDEGSEEQYSQKEQNHEQTQQRKLQSSRGWN